ncbi:CysB family transcriptional regulator [Sulfuriferula plumbiphila]|uniref:CysB family transcriptional regulator n=1 Tax=Sulfuriferula plumbiphila TaxID=171865 RepID=A0A512LB92_9PROT|nr:HTH-type transcriptional regulator CysB [Sulfuriferula plumbiphila]BBP04453.1 CysB family transcriptional regulator [Sulfuriferula plumbiphila]GEP31755.1 CysB family transcriptional regulator [Sulfuriferula plumbiphila]
MKIQQLRYLHEVARQGLNVSLAAEKLHTSQPGVSKQIQLLEEELGVDILVRHGKRVTGITEPGQKILAITERILREAENLKRVGADFTNETHGSLSIATTHTQARYALPSVIKTFSERYPGVQLRLHQGNPAQIVEMVLSGEADIAIATEAIALHDELVTLPCYQWNRCVIVQPDHPLLGEPTLTLERIADYSIITYDFAFAGRSQINKAFMERNLSPNVVLTAIDADVIKTYVGIGLGIGIMASMAFDPGRDQNLRAIDASHLFEPSTTRIGIRQGTYLRGYTFEFIQMFAPHLNHEAVNMAISAACRSAHQEAPKI